MQIYFITEQLSQLSSSNYTIISVYELAFEVDLTVSAK